MKKESLEVWQFIEPNLIYSISFEYINLGMFPKLPLQVLEREALNDKVEV